MFAPQVDHAILQLNHASRIVDEATEVKMCELFDALELLTPIDTDKKRKLWLAVPRGSIDVFGDYDEMLADEQVTCRKDFEDLWHIEYPEEICWYQLITIERFNYKAVFLKNKLIMELWPESRTGHFNMLGDRYFTFIDWLIVEVKKCIAMIRAGTYNEYVSKHLSWRFRTGMILRKDEWRVFPERKEYLLKGLSNADLQEFLADMAAGDEITHGRLNEMTSGLFFRCCAIGYSACGYNWTDLPDKEQYRRHSDGRDEGLLEIDENDHAAFKSWYFESDRYGGHPWEVCRGGNSTHIDLFVCHDERGYFLNVAGKAWNRCVEAVHFYLALKQAGIPVGIHSGHAMATRFCGNDYVGIVPEGVIPRYCSDMFHREKIIDFMNLDPEETEKLLPYIRWQPLNEARVREK